MTSSAFSFLDGRTSLDAAPVGVHHKTRRHGAFVSRMRRRFRRAQLASALRERDRRYTSDAYLDRAGLSSVDWPTVMADHARR